VLVNVTLKLLELVAVPVGLVTEIVPEVALVESTVNDAATPLNFTLVVVLKLVPVITTLVFINPAVGENPEIDGGGFTRLSILALNAEAIGPGSAVKKEKPVCSSIECADVT
jgi:hypothetical protein